jgi:hypothetical protein
MTPIPPEFHVGQHVHDYDTQIPQELAPLLFAGLIAFPIIWYFSHKNKTIP